MGLSSQTAILNLHDFDTSFTNEFDNDQTAVNLITPSTGATIKVAGAYIVTEGTSGYVRIYFADDENDNQNTILTVFPGTTAASGYVPLVMRGDRNAQVKITSTVGSGQNIYILVNYKEE